MLTMINNDYRPWPMVAGLGLVGGTLLGLIAVQMFVLQGFEFKPPGPTVIVRLVHPPKPVKSAPKAIRAKRETAVAKAKPALVAMHKPSASVRPDTPEWRAHVEHGRELAFDIHAYRSLPVLQAYGITLAIAAKRPRGQTHLYNLRDKRLYWGPVPESVIVRELDELPSSPDLDKAVAAAERELGSKARIFALYPIDLYDALKSLTEEVLRQEAVPLNSVSIARVELRLQNGRNFVVKLVNHS